MIENKFTRAAEDDPNRCQAVHANFQCPFLAKPGLKYCPRHAGMSVRSEEKNNLTLYRLQKWKERLGDHIDHPKAKSLREEMGILRIVLEEQLNSCRDPSALLMKSGAIVEISREIGKLVKLAQQLEKETFQSLDKARAMELIEKIGDILILYIPEPEILEAVESEMKSVLEVLTTDPTARS